MRDKGVSKVSFRNSDPLLCLQIPRMHYWWFPSSRKKITIQSSLLRIKMQKNPEQRNFSGNRSKLRSKIGKIKSQGQLETKLDRDKKLVACIRVIVTRLKVQINQILWLFLKHLTITIKCFNQFRRSRHLLHAQKDLSKFTHKEVTLKMSFFKKALISIQN